MAATLRQAKRVVALVTAIAVSIAVVAAVLGARLASEQHTTMMALARALLENARIIANFQRS